MLAGITDFSGGRFRDVQDCKVLMKLPQNGTHFDGPNNDLWLKGEEVQRGNPNSSLVQIENVTGKRIYALLNTDEKPEKGACFVGQADNMSDTYVCCDKYDKSIRACHRQDQKYLQYRFKTFLQKNTDSSKDGRCQIGKQSGNNPLINGLNNAYNPQRIQTANNPYFNEILRGLGPSRSI